VLCFVHDDEAALPLPPTVLKPLEKQIKPVAELFERNLDWIARTDGESINDDGKQAKARLVGKCSKSTPNHVLAAPSVANGSPNPIAPGVHRTTMQLDIFLLANLKARDALIHISDQVVNASLKYGDASENEKFLVSISNRTGIINIKYVH
jgi:hypothetical protein